MEEIWKQLPIEITCIILEHMCVVKIREKLLELEFGFLIDELKKHRALIAGSFILQCFLGETYEHSDIDLYVPFTTNNTKSSFRVSKEKLIEIVLSIDEVYTMEHEGNHLFSIYVDGYCIACTSHPFIVVDKLCKLIHTEYWCEIKTNLLCIDITRRFLSTSQPVQPLEGIIYDTLRDDFTCHGDSEPYSISDDIKYCRYFSRYDREVCSPSVNTVVVSESNLGDFIDKNFDSDLCSLWFDGDCMNLKFRFLAINLLNKNMLMTINHTKSINRLRKYKDRGFKIKLNPSDVKLLN